MSVVDRSRDVIEERPADSGGLLVRSNCYSKSGSDL
jgi:hypothetical protein